MKKNTVLYTITAKKEDYKDKEESIRFKIELDETGEITDSYSFNPTYGWTSYHNWWDGWSEQDPELNELLTVIDEVTQNTDYLVPITEWVLSSKPNDETVMEVNTTIYTHDFIRYYEGGYIIEVSHDGEETE